MENQSNLDLNTSQGLIKAIKERKEFLEHKNFIKLLIENINFGNNEIYSKEK